METKTNQDLLNTKDNQVQVKEVTNGHNFRSYDHVVITLFEQEQLDYDYVSPVDTSVTGLLQRNNMYDTNKNYGGDIPDLSNVSLMEVHKMATDYRESKDYYQNKLDNIIESERIEKTAPPSSLSVEEKDQ